MASVIFGVWEKEINTNYIEIVYRAGHSAVHAIVYWE